MSECMKCYRPLSLVLQHINSTSSYQRNSFPFRGKAGMGVGANAWENPTPILTFPLKGKGLYIGIDVSKLMCHSTSSLSDFPTIKVLYSD